MNSRQAAKPPSRVLKRKGLVFILAICYLGTVASLAYALDLTKLKASFLEGDYGSAIKEGESILAEVDYTADLDELYYILGLSYLKEENYLRASDIFEIILNEFKGSKFKLEAMLARGDAYFALEDYLMAQRCYEELLKSNPEDKLKFQGYSRLAQIGFKKGDNQQAKLYLDKIKQEFPSDAELPLDSEFCLPKDRAQDFYYTVQVGSFMNLANANNLAQKLTQEDFLAYVEESLSGESKSYRVKVGKMSLREEAEDLAKKLSDKGFPTKISP